MIDFCIVCKKQVTLSKHAGKLGKVHFHNDCGKNLTKTHMQGIQHYIPTADSVTLTALSNEQLDKLYGAALAKFMSVGAYVKEDLMPPAIEEIERNGSSTEADEQLSKIIGILESEYENFAFTASNIKAVADSRGFQLGTS